MIQQSEDTIRIPFEGVTTEHMSEGLDFEGHPERSSFIFFSRTKGRYHLDRHLIPGPAQIIIDGTIRGIEENAQKYGYDSDYVYDQALMLPKMLMLAQQMTGLLNLAKEGITFSDATPTSSAGRPVLTVVS